MIDLNNFEAVLQVFGIIGLAAVSFAMAYQKFANTWKAGSVESSIITVMHRELERMNEQNTSLSSEIGRLHQQILTLNRQLQELSVENQRLQNEVITLTNEVSDFKASIFMKGREHATS